MGGRPRREKRGGAEAFQGKSSPSQIARHLVATAIACLAATVAAAEDAPPPAPAPPKPPVTPPPAAQPPKAVSAAEKPAPGAPIQAATATPATPADDLHAAVDRFVGAPVHGSLTVRYLARWTADRTDQDLIQYLNASVGDESRDRWSGSLSVRVVEDLDGGRSSDKGENVFYSLNDTFHSSVTALLYTAYATVRPEGGAFEWARFGRQYGYYAETFQYDGVTASTRPLVDSIKLRLTGYAGLPVHYYEASSSGDWLAGLRAEAAPWRGGRAALDYTHVQDELAYLGSGKARNDLVAASAWQHVAKYADLFGQFTWLDVPRDVTLRGTWAMPDDAFTVQASWYRLLHSKEQTATEFDAYTAVLGELNRYQQFDLHVSKGFGDHFDVDAGVQARRLVPGEETGPFNRDTTRVYVTPSMTDLPWKGFSLSVTYDSYSGGGEDLQAWAADAAYKVSKTTKVSVGSDYSLYAFGPLDEGERTHVRTAYVRLRTALTAALSADVQYTWEKDDVETFQIFSAALVLDF